jgi:hypothetical protein
MARTVVDRPYPLRSRGDRQFASWLGIGPALKLRGDFDPPRRASVRSINGRIRFEGFVDLEKHGWDTAVNVIFRLRSSGPIGWLIVMLGRRFVGDEKELGLGNLATQIAELLVQGEDSEWTEERVNAMAQTMWPGAASRAAQPGGSERN